MTDFTTIQKVPDIKWKHRVLEKILEEENYGTASDRDFKFSKTV